MEIIGIEVVAKAENSLEIMVASFDSREAPAGRAVPRFQFFATQSVGDLHHFEKPKHQSLGDRYIICTVKLLEKLSSSWLSPDVQAGSGGEGQLERVYRGMPDAHVMKISPSVLSDQTNGYSTANC